MKILTLKLLHVFGRKEMYLKFCNPDEVTPPVYVLHEPQEYERITTAVQLVCSSKYDSLQKLHPIWPRIKGGSVQITFTLNREKPVPVPAESSDSDVPCTSQQAKRRAGERKARAALTNLTSTEFEVRAQRSFHAYPLTVNYSINNGPLFSCNILRFNVMFFACTDIIFPHLSALSYDACKNGRWLDLLSNNVLNKERGGENNLILKFCKLYSSRKIVAQEPICQMTTSFLIGRYSVDQTRIAYLIQIFQQIRCIFEFLTFFEYTVWFLLPQRYGDLSDISDITAENLNFDLLQTKMQLKKSQDNEEYSPKYPWTEAEDFVRELFLVAVQLAFGLSCRQNIIYLHNLDALYKHQNFEYIRYMFAQSSGDAETWPIKNYLQRIVDACIKCNLTCIIEYSGGVPFQPKNCFSHRPKRTTD